MGQRNDSWRERRRSRKAVQCPECGSMFTPLMDWMTFCCRAHQSVFNNRLAVRGKVIAPLALAWAEGKGGGHSRAHPTAMAAFREMTQICREFNAEDKRAGRPAAVSYAAALMDRGLPADRRKGR